MSYDLSSTHPEACIWAEKCACKLDSKNCEGCKHYYPIGDKTAQEQYDLLRAKVYHQRWMEDWNELIETLDEEGGQGHDS